MILIRGLSLRFHMEWLVFAKMTLEVVCACVYVERMGGASERVTPRSHLSNRTSDF